MLGIKHLHENNIIHFDLKPENIMIKVSEFSSIKLLNNNKKIEIKLIDLVHRSIQIMFYLEIEVQSNIYNLKY